MYQHDYIMRLIDQFTQVLARAIGLKEQQKYDEALEIVDQSLYGQLNLPQGWPLNEDLPQLNAQLHKELPEKAEHWSILCSLLYERAELLFRMKNKEDSKKLSESLVILLTELINAPGQVFSLENHTRLENVLFRLRQYPLANHTYSQIIRHYRKQHKFAIAEDWLFEALELVEDKMPLLQIGKAFYSELQQESDAVLSRGGLSRAELDSGLADLEAYPI